MERVQRKQGCMEATAEIKRRYPTASVIDAERIVFNIGGNAYRLCTARFFALTERAASAFFWRSRPSSETIARHEPHLDTLRADARKVDSRSTHSESHRADSQRKRVLFSKKRPSAFIRGQFGLELLARFVQHVLPPHFVKIRHY